MRWIAIGCLAMFAACGGGQKAESNDQCKQVAAHMVGLAMQDNGTLERPPDMDGVEQEFAKQCHSTPWSAARQSCLLGAANQEQTLTCPLD